MLNTINFKQKAQYNSDLRYVSDFSPFIAISPNHAFYVMRVLPGGADLGVFDLDTHQLICKLEGNDHILTCAVVSLEPRSNRLLVIAGDNTGQITIWDLVQSMKPILCWRGDQHPVTCCVAYIDPVSQGLRLISTAYTIQSWNLSPIPATPETIQGETYWVLTHDAPIEHCVVYLDRIKNKLWLASCDRSGNIIIGNKHFSQSKNDMQTIIIPAEKKREEKIIFYGFHLDKSHNLHFAYSRKNDYFIAWHNAEQPGKIVEKWYVGLCISVGNFYTHPNGSSYILAGDNTCFFFCDFISPAYKISFTEALRSFVPIERWTHDIINCLMYVTVKNPIPYFLLIISNNATIIEDRECLICTCHLPKLVTIDIFNGGRLTSTGHLVARIKWREEWPDSVKHAIAYYDPTMKKQLILFNDNNNKRYLYDSFQLKRLPSHLLNAQDFNNDQLSRTKKAELGFHRLDKKRISNTACYINTDYILPDTTDLPYILIHGVIFISLPKTGFQVSCCFVYYDILQDKPTDIIVASTMGSLKWYRLTKIEAVSMYEWQGHSVAITCCCIYEDAISQQLRLVSCDTQGKTCLWNLSSMPPQKIGEWQANPVPIRCCTAFLYYNTINAYILTGDIAGNITIYPLTGSQVIPWHGKLPTMRNGAPSVPVLFYLTDHQSRAGKLMQTYLNVLTNKGYVYSINWGKLWQATPIQTLQTLALKQFSRSLRYDKIEFDEEDRQKVYKELVSRRFLSSPAQEFTLLSRLMGERKEYFANLPREIGGTSPLILMCEKCRRKKYLCVC